MSESIRGVCNLGLTLAFRLSKGVTPLMEQGIHPYQPIGHSRLTTLLMAFKCCCDLKLFDAEFFSFRMAWCAKTEIFW